MSRSLVVALALVAIAASPVSAQSADITTPPPISGHSRSTPDTFDAGDAMARLLFVHENLEQIRIYMGRPATPPPLFVAMDANADEAYFTALNLFRRTMRLAFEQLRIEQKWKFKIPEQPTPFDIYDVVDSLAMTALQLNQALGITHAVKERPQPSGTSMTALVNQMFATGALLNGLLDQRTSAEDMFTFLTVVVRQSMELHRHYTRQLMPEPPAFVPNKTPADVLAAIEPVMELVRELGAQQGLTMLTLKRSTDRPVVPDDVSELGVVIVGELNRIFIAAGIERETRRVGAIGRKFPAHSVRRAGLIRKILEQTVAAARQRK